MPKLKAKIKELAARSAPEIVTFRRHLHANPELSFEEVATSKFVASTLNSMGLQSNSMAETGQVAFIHGNNPEKKTIVLRADMDALPIAEQNEVSYKSTRAGVMHACGHDVHTASLLGVARILNLLRDSFEGTSKLIFQPGEERIPGGASLMIKEGVLEDPSIRSIFGQHVMPMIDVGKVGFRKGMYMASADEIYLTVKGKGGHGAIPNQVIDPVLITSHIIVALQQVISRNADPKTPSVLTFGKVIANGATNVIPDEVKIEGTFRTLDEEWRARAKQLITKIAKGTAEAMGAECQVNILHGFPYLENNPELTGRARSYAEEFLGKENVLDLDLWMAAEDFAFYSQMIDACFYRLGVRNEAKGITSPVHTPTFDIDEQALEIGAGLMAWLAVRELGND